jgi:hypothetical protein
MKRPLNETVRDGILLRGPWFKPYFVGRLRFPDILPILIDSPQATIREALQTLETEGALKRWPADDSFEPLPAGWAFRESLVRERGWRHPTLLRQREIDLDELVLAIVIAPLISARHAQGAFLRSGRMPSRALRIYLVEYDDAAIKSVVADLARKGLIESHVDSEAGGLDWMLRATGYGERAYQLRLEKLGLDELDTILDEKERHSVKIFSIWQSDYNASRSHIADALLRVVQQLNKDYTLVVPLEIEEAARVGDGASRIDVALMQRIRDADYVIADVTPVFAYENRLVVNSNVLIEVGYALAARSPDRLLLVEREVRTNELLQSNPTARMFDIDHVNRIIYKNPSSLRERLLVEFKERLKAVGLVRSE